MLPEQIPTIIIVDDHPVVIEGLQRLLLKEKQVRITGSFTSRAPFLSFFRENPSDLVLLDIMLPDGNGMEICKEIKLIAPDTSVLILSNHNDRSMILQALQNGASGYLLKNVSPEELKNCIRDTMNGQLTFSKEVQEIITRPSVNEFRPVPQLTRREKEILQLIAEGMTSAGIAERLSLSPLTVETHRKNLLQKFEVNNVAALIKVAAQLQLL